MQAMLHLPFKRRKIYCVDKHVSSIFPTTRPGPKLDKIRSFFWWLVKFSLREVIRIMILLPLGRKSYIHRDKNQSEFKKSLRVACRPASSLSRSKYHPWGKLS